MNRSILASNIRLYRKAAGLTQDQLGAQLFLSPQTVSKWENGLTVPDLENVCQLAQALHVSMDMLFEGVIPPIGEAAYLGVDGGGTKTEFVLFTADGQVLSRLVTQGSNPNVYGLDEACKTLCHGIDAMLQIAKYIGGIFIGVAGAGSANHAIVMEKRLQEKYPHIPLRVGSDIFNVFYSAEEQPNITVILGTGMIVYTKTANGLRRLGGYGYLLDGAGSGYDIGRDILHACLESEDKLRSETPLLQSARSKWGGGRLWDVLNTVYDGGREYIASFAPLAFSAYENGDTLAEEILHRNFERTADLLDAAHEQYGAKGPVILAGGLTAHKDIVSDLLRAHMKTPMSFIFPDQPPIYGACVYCRQLYVNDSKPTTFKSLFSTTYEKAKGESSHATD